jgi:hypothetical protein
VHKRNVVGSDLPASEAAPSFFLKINLFEKRNSKSTNQMIFEVLKNSKDCQISIFGLECAAKNIDIWFLARFG